MGLNRLGFVVCQFLLLKYKIIFAVKALFVTGVLGAPSASPDKPAAPASGYGAAAQPACTLQRVETPSGYGCSQEQECSTEYEQECSTEYDEQCETKYEQKCETRYEDQCSTEYDQQCQTTYEQQCKTEYDTQCETKYDTKVMSLTLSVSLKILILV